VLTRDGCGNHRARVQLVEPAAGDHTLAADQDYAGPGADWSIPFEADSRKPRTGSARMRLQLVRDGEPSTHQQRWRPTPLITDR
jgi:anthraniloyl-CoA monooxygenase